MSKVLAITAEVVAGIALVATGVGAIAMPAFAGVVTLAGVSTTAMFAASAALTVAAELTANHSTAKSAVSPFAWKADPQAGIPYAMGECYVGGNICYRMAYGDDNKYQTLVTILSGGGPHEAIEQLYFDNVQRGWAQGGGIAIGYTDAYARTQLGAQPEASNLLCQPIDPYQWTGDCKLSGYAATIVTLTYDTKGKHTLTSTPQLGWYGKWAKVYDPRKDSTYPGGAGSHRWIDETTWEWSANPYLNALTWLIGRRHNGKLALGIGVPDLTNVIVSQFVDGANVADANGWTCHGLVYSTDDKWDVLKKILRAGAGQPLKLGAQIGVLVNAPKVSLATIGVSDLSGDCSVQATQGRKNRLNAIVPRYMGRLDTTTYDATAGSNVTSTTFDYMSGAPIVVDDYVTFDGKQRQREVTYDMVTSLNQAAQLARYDIEDAREFGPITLKLKLRWMGFRPGDVVTANLPELGLNGQDILIMTRMLNPADGTVTLTCRSETAGKHPFALGQTTTPPETPGLSGPPLVPVPGPAAWAISGTAIANGSDQIPAIVVSGAADSDVIDAVVFDYRIYTGTQGDDDDWRSEGAEAPSVTTKVITAVVQEAQYQVSVRYRKGAGISQSRLILGPVTVGADSASQSAAQALAAVTTIASDGYISAGQEKRNFVRIITDIENEKPVLDAQAATLGIDTSVYDNAYAALMAYIGGLSPAWSDLTHDTAVNPTTLNGRLSDYEYAKISLVSASANAAAQSQGFTNLIKYSRMEAGNRGWAVRYNPASIPVTIGNATLVEAGNYGDGYEYVQIQATPSAAGQTISIGTQQGYEFPVTAGSRLFVSCGGQSFGTEGSFVIGYYASDGSSLPQSTISARSSVPAFSQLADFVTVPEGAVKGYIELYSTSGAGDIGSERDAGITKPMVCVVPQGQSVWPAFVPGPNSDDAADVTDTAWNSLTGQSPADTKAQLDEATTTAQTASDIANQAQAFTNDVADNGKFSSDEKKRYVALVNQWSVDVPNAVHNATDLGLNAEASALSTAWSNFYSYLQSVGYSDVGHTSSIDRNQFINLSNAFSAAETALSNASRNYAGTLSQHSSANIFLDPRFERPTDQTAWTNFDSRVVIQESVDGRRVQFPPGQSSEMDLVGYPIVMGPTDRIDVEFEYYVETVVTGAARFGIYSHAFDGSGNGYGGGGVIPSVADVPRQQWLTYRGSIYGSDIGGNLAALQPYLVCQPLSGGNVYMRNPRGYRVPGANTQTTANGRQVSSSAQSTNSLLGIKTLQSLQSAIGGQTNTGSSISVNINAFSITLDTGAVVNYPSATISGLAYSTLYYIYRDDPDLTGTGSYQVTTNLAIAQGAGRIYLGFVGTMDATGTGGSSGGGSVGDRNPSCVDADALVATSEGDIPARDVRPGMLIWCLAQDMQTMELAPVLSSRLAAAVQSTVSAGAAVLDLASDTPMDFPGGHGIAANAWAFPVATWRGPGETVEWHARGAVEAVPELRDVAHISLGGRVFAARRAGSRAYLLSHNVYK